MSRILPIGRSSSFRTSRSGPNGNDRDLISEFIEDIARGLAKGIKTANETLQESGARFEMPAAVEIALPAVDSPDAGGIRFTLDLKALPPDEQKKR